MATFCEYSWIYISKKKLDLAYVQLDGNPKAGNHKDLLGFIFKFLKNI